MKYDLMKLDKDKKLLFKKYGYVYDKKFNTFTAAPKILNIVNPSEMYITFGERGFDLLSLEIYEDKRPILKTKYKIIDWPQWPCDALNETLEKYRKMLLDARIYYHNWKVSRTLDSF